MHTDEKSTTLHAKPAIPYLDQKRTTKALYNSIPLEGLEAKLRQASPDQHYTAKAN